MWQKHACTIIHGALFWQKKKNVSMDSYCCSSFLTTQRFSLVILWRQHSSTMQSQILWFPSACWNFNMRYILSFCCSVNSTVAVSVSYNWVLWVWTREGHTNTLTHTLTLRHTEVITLEEVSRCVCARQYLWSSLFTVSLFISLYSLKSIWILLTCLLNAVCVCIYMCMCVSVDGWVYV